MSNRLVRVVLGVIAAGHLIRLCLSFFDGTASTEGWGYVSMSFLTILAATVCLVVLSQKRVVPNPRVVPKPAEL